VRVLIEFEAPAKGLHAWKSPLTERLCGKQKVSPKEVGSVTTGRVTQASRGIRKREKDVRERNQSERLRPSWSYSGYLR